MRLREVGGMYGCDTCGRVYQLRYRRCPHCRGYRNHYEPSAEEIRVACEVLRTRWPAARLARCELREEYEVPEVLGISPVRSGE